MAALSAPSTRTKSLSGGALGIVVRLVGQACQGLVLAQYRQHFEYTRRGSPAGESGAQRLRNRAELETSALGKRANRGLSRLRSPRLHCGKLRSQVGKERAPAGVEERRRFLVRGNRALRIEIAGAIDQLD